MVRFGQPCRVRWTTVALVAVGWQVVGWTNAFQVARPTTLAARAVFRESFTLLFDEPPKTGGGGSGGNPFDFLFNPYESKIPKEIEKEIYEAEGKTEAAKDRAARVARYAVIALVGLVMAFFNGFLTELRASADPDGVPFDIHESPFAWVDSNFFTSFLFMNKIGGLLCLLTGAGAGLLAEAEQDSRRINAEKIYEELVRRREKKEKLAERSGSAPQRKRKKKKRRATKGLKRMEALAEVIDQPAAAASSPPSGDDKLEEAAAKQILEESQESPAEEPKKEEKDGLLDSLKGFYDKADSMAASQALLLNKKLEDSGVLEKITDETGMRVIGKEEAAKRAAELEKEKKE